MRDPLESKGLIFMPGSEISENDHTLPFQIIGTCAKACLILFGAIKSALCVGAKDKVKHALRAALYSSV